MIILINYYFRLLKHKIQHKQKYMRYQYFIYNKLHIVLKMIKLMKHLLKNFVKIQNKLIKQINLHQLMKEQIIIGYKQENV